MINSSNNNTSNNNETNNNNSAEEKVSGFCESIMQSIHAITSIYKDSGYIISSLKNDPYYSKFKWPMRKLIIIRSIWLVMAICMELAVSFPFNWIMTALQHKDSGAFYQAMKYYMMVVIITGPVLAIDHYLTDKLYILFRKMTTEILLNRYHSNNNYYHITSLNEVVDNPGQRLDQDVDNFCWGITKFMVLIVSQFLRLIGWSGLLYYIGAKLIVYGFILAVFLVMISIILFASKLTYIAYLLSKHSADFRAGIIRTRDNAETIAFLDASNFEQYWNNQRFKKLINTLLLQAQWSSGLEFMTKNIKYISQVLPLYLLISSYIDGNLTLGQVSQSCYAFGELLFALTIVVSEMNRLSSIQAGGKRITDVIIAMDKINQKIPCLDGHIIGSPRNSVRHLHDIDIDINNDNNISNNAGAITTIYDGINIIEITIEQSKNEMLLFTDNLSIIVPNTHSLLLYKLNIEIAKHQNVLIIGPSGAGKSSLLRVICGLWKWGKGTIHKLKNENIMFLPQRPYIPILCEGKNTLKNQLLFPNLNNEHDNNQELSNRKFHQILQRVNLEYILDYENNEDSQDWSKLLSLGEQQRLSFGRILASKPPQMLFLDEATSAMDVENQDLMYRLLQNENITYLSVGHRQGLIEYHHIVLQIIGDGSWKLWSRDNWLQHQQQNQDLF